MTDIEQTKQDMDRWVRRIGAYASRIENIEQKIEDIDEALTYQIELIDILQERIRGIDSQLLLINTTLSRMLKSEEGRTDEKKTRTYPRQ